MDEKISQKAIEQYSEAYAFKIVSAFFDSEERITGPEIMTLCDIKQVNLFVLRELMRVWRVESQNLKSPYFNYQAKEVTEEMQHFQNTLSNHISVSRTDFLPLLKNAVAQALYVVLSPYDFYSSTLDRQGQGYITITDLRSDIKYLKNNQAPIKNSLTINQKFMFTKILFKGDFEIFSQAIERLDALNNLGQALEYLETHYKEWDKESEEYQEFLSLVERRFVIGNL